MTTIEVPLTIKDIEHMPANIPPEWQDAIEGWAAEIAVVCGHSHSELRHALYRLTTPDLTIGQLRRFTLEASRLAARPYGARAEHRRKMKRKRAKR